MTSKSANASSATRKQKILIIEDEPDVIELLRHNFSQAGYATEHAMTGGDGLRMARTACPDLILLDLMLPEIDGFQICKLLRYDSKTSCIPIVMLTARSSEIDRVLGFELGAEDYVTKPFSPRELILRIKRILERTRFPESQNESFRFGDLLVDIPRHLVNVSGARIDLTATEFRLLVTLIQRRGIVQSRDQLLRDVWDCDKQNDARTVDTHMRRLREKLGNIGASYLDTVRGVGYRFLAN